ncbi:MAG: sulfite reductase flavoprotein subunit alpha [Bacteroidales bacterium]|nr:sulfite reductase flavoprotein subunit alpha [Bacteroidales bacterium]
MTGDKDLLHVIYGSRTGNSRSAAALAHAYAKFLGIQSELIDMQAFPPENIGKVENMLITVSTHGEGDPPLAAEKLLSYLAGGSAPRMDRRKFSILALGDSSYRHFCKTGHDFRDSLIRLGAEEVYNLQECDIDFEEGAKSWVEGAVNAFREILPALETKNNRSFTFELMAPGDASGDFYSARIIEKKILNESNPLKQTMHVKLSLKNSGIAYEPGDTIGVSAFNSRMLVDDLIKGQGWDPTHVLREKERIGMLKQALISDYELTLLTPLVLKKYAALAQNQSLNKLLQNEKLLTDYCNTRDIVDMLTDFPAGTNIDDLVKVMRKLTPRLYSVASSPKVAFSRDQAEKVYVTQRMLEHSSELFRWISDGAVVYLCGNKRKLAVSARSALQSILEREGPMTPDKAALYLEKMKAERQYCEDVY